MRFFFAALAVLAFGCSGTNALRRQLQTTEEKFNDHVGFILYDPEARKTLLEYNSSKYFTPASNTKIFTFYTALQLLGDSVPGLRYTITNDSLIFKGTGDPSFLYRETCQSTRIYDFLKEASQKIFFSDVNFMSEPFGPGWAWDDYPYAYSAERSPFPVYGNLVKVVEAPDLSHSTIPILFSNELVTGDSVRGRAEVGRDVGSNQVIFHPGKKASSRHSWEVPFQTSTDLLVELLADTLKREVGVYHKDLPDSGTVLFSVPADSLYRVMMQESDNFIAEQLLLMCAEVVSDTMRAEIGIRYAVKNYLFDLPDKPEWVDGSGLSRYNLFTPRSVARLWEKIYSSVPRERLFSILAVGGKSGTLKNGFKDGKPWIYGKTGSLSNNNSLSGYLVTAKGKILIFSFMNANFVVPTREIRSSMEEFLRTIRDKY